MTRGRWGRIRDLGLALVLILAIALKLYQVEIADRQTHLNQDQIARIASPSGPFSFAVMGDSRDTVLTFSNLARQINSENVLFSIGLGDLIYDYHLFRYRVLLRQLRQLSQPLLTVVGNHELKDGGEKARERYLQYFGPFDYSFAVKDCYFMALDNTEDKISPRQMAWLKQELEKARGYRYRFVFVHVPLFDPRPDHHWCMSDPKNVQAFNQLLDDYQVTMLFAGHIHAYFRGVWGKTPYIITAGGGATLSQTGPDHQFYHYLRVDVSDAGVEYQVIKLKPAQSEILDDFLYNATLFKEGFLVDTLLLLTSLYFVLSFSAKKIRKLARRGSELDI